MRPKKKYGQHFLEAAWADKLVAAIDPQPDDRFVEIGPGPGALTLRLAPRVARLTAIELDADMVAALQSRLPANATVVQSDFLEFDLSSLAAYSMGGTGVTPEHVAAADRAGFAGSRSYGLTEHSTVSVGWRDMPFEQRAQTDGRVQPGSEVRIVDELERELPRGSDGEILVRGPELFIGYTDAALNAQAFTTDGWFRTGDIGRFDSANCLTLTDRKKDIVIRGGENISSQEVERVLATHPAVQDVAVVAQPDPRYGEKVCAFVVLHSGGSLDLAGVQQHFAAAGVARQKTPEGLHVVNELPRTASGKVKKGELRERARA